MALFGNPGEFVLAAEFECSYKSYAYLLTTPAMDGDGKTVPNCDIELSHVTFAYNQEDVIKDVSCKIPQGA